MVDLAIAIDNVVHLPQPNRFEEFWAIFPKRAGKAMALARWNAITSPTGLRTRALDKSSGTFINLTLSATPDEIIEGALRYRKAQIDGTKCCSESKVLILKDDGKFTCHPANWLNQGRWMDD